MAKAQLYEPMFYGLSDPTDQTADGIFKPINGGSVYFYTVGTTTPKNIYNNADKGSTVTNPVTLDANGRGTAYLDGKYRIVVKDSGGSTIFDIAEWSEEVDVHASLIISSALEFPAGSAAAPSITISGDTNTGLYQVAADSLGVSVGGSRVAGFDANGVYHTAGTATNPGLSLDGDRNTGLYSSGADTLDVTLGGTRTASIGTNGIQLVDGVVATPAVSFLSDPDTGIYNSGANQVAVSLGGTKKAELTSSGLYVADDIYTTAWTSWSPTFQGNAGMTYTSVTATVARYKIVGKICFFELSFRGTTAGTADAVISFTAPTTPANASSSTGNPGGGCVCYNTTSEGGFWFYLNATGDWMGVALHDSATWGLAANTGANITGFFEVA